jgi:hypothetical protein
MRQTEPTCSDPRDHFVITHCHLAVAFHYYGCRNANQGARRFRCRPGVVIVDAGTDFKEARRLAL